MKAYLFTLFLLSTILVESSNAAEISGPASQQRHALFLPVVSEAYPTLIDKVSTTLRDQGIDNIDVKNVDFWHPYQRGLKDGRPGIYFTQPHFAAWVINKHNFVPVLKLHGQLKYVLAVRRADDHLFELSDLAGKTICREPGLNLGAVWLNKVLGEHRLTVRGEERPSIKNALKKSDPECHAFVVNDYVFEKANVELLGKYIRFAQSPVYKHNVLVAHRSIPPALLSELRTAIKSKPMKRALNPYLADLSKWQNLLPVKLNDYNTQDAELLAPYWGN